MNQAGDVAVGLTPCGKLADATFPQGLENPPGVPQPHSLDDGIHRLTSYRGTVRMQVALDLVARMHAMTWRLLNPKP